MLVETHIRLWGWQNETLRHTESCYIELSNPDFLDQIRKSEKMWYPMSSGHSKEYHYTIL